jgi:hypothetical protein
MKLRMKLIVLLSLIAVIWSTAAHAAPKSFTDVSSKHWAKQEIDYLVQDEGYADGSFGVNKPITRAEAASLIMRTFGWVGEWSNPGFTDVKTTHWAYTAIAGMVEMDIFKPSGKKFQPNLPLTRAEMADILVNRFQLTSIKAGKYTDLTPEHWGYASIQKLTGSNITFGYPDGTFRPDANVTRAEFAVFLSRALDEDFRLSNALTAKVEGLIYDLEVADQYYQLNHPLILFEQWYAPVELFEKVGFYINSTASDRITLVNTEGIKIELQQGQSEIWVGETSVEIEDPLIEFNGTAYIAASGIFTALEKPIVFYPDNFLIALEQPTITAADIVKQMPQSAIDVLHSKQPYWHWSKRDRDYLELMKKNKEVSAKGDQLLKEMKQLTDAYFKAEREKTVVKGITYYSDNVTGKLDALSRGIEARYLLLYETNSYAYPEIGKSGALGSFSGSANYFFNYIVYDHNFDHYEENKKGLVNALQNEFPLDYDLFDGLVIHGIPFSINERNINGQVSSWAGLARGSRDMLVVNSGKGTFYHELGHNWDAMFGDDEQYLKLRGKAGYEAASSDWANRVGENFAEDFVIAFMPGADSMDHSGVFEAPTKEQVEAFRKWVGERSQGERYTYDETLLGGTNLVPSVIYISDGRLDVQGNSSHQAVATITDLATNEQTVIELTGADSSYDKVLQLPTKGVYDVIIGSIKTIVVYE